MSYSYRLTLLLLFHLIAFSTFGQQYCPPNIGFESGTLDNWSAFYGTNKGGPIVTKPGVGRHLLLQNTSPQAKDPYGGFPVNSPNGSKYTLMLGNNNSAADVDGVKYRLQIPANVNRYSLTYYYAVVLQNPGHDAFDQPAFSVDIIDVTGGGNTQVIYKSDLTCGVHTFTAENGQLGFKEAGSGGQKYQYKEWSPVNLNITGYEGHTLELTFTAVDCNKGGHFGFAYLDFEETCKSPITGNNYCLNQSSSITLTAPPGYEGYAWSTKAKMDEVLGTDYTLTIQNPVLGTEYALIVKPFTNLGCPDTLYTTINSINQSFELKVSQTPLEGCEADGYNLELASVTAGSIPADMTFEYYVDPNGQTYVQDRKRVPSGTYYIRGTSTAGCTDIKPVTVTLSKGPDLEVRIPGPVCKPNFIKLSDYVTPGLNSTVKVYSDVNLTTEANINRIENTGTYYVVAISNGVPCKTVKPVQLVVSASPIAEPKKWEGCPPQSLYAPLTGNSESANGVSYAFFYDQAGARPLLGDPTKMTASGRYYYRGTNVYGCTGNMSYIDLTIFPEPFFTVKEPAAVVFPETINLATTHNSLITANFTYWKNAQCSIPVENYSAVGESGTYYIKAVNTTKCEVIHPVKVLVNAPPEANLVVANTFTPNGDGINDEFKPTTEGALKVNFLKIFNRYGKLVFETREVLNRWTGDVNGQPSPAGTYYWVFSCYDVYRKQAFTRSGQLTLVR